MTSEQAFDILGIHDRNIDEASLKKAFYSAARRTHPDSNPDDENAKAKFHLMNEAYEVLCEYLKYEKKQKAESNKSKGTANGGKDVWEAYSEADLKYAKKRHNDASEKAAETIRNHEKHEQEKIRREQKEKEVKEQARREQEERERILRQEMERRAKQEQEAAYRAEQEQKRRERRQEMREMTDDAARQIMTLSQRLGDMCSRKVKKGLLITLIVIFLGWAGLEIIGAVRGLTNFVQILASIAKWILIVWMSGKITDVVQKNWKNRILSVFAFLVSMELEIVLMKWLEDIVRSIHIVHIG